MKKVIILAVLTLVGQTSWADNNRKLIRDFQTTRLISTGGAGVASILSTESAILNPASSAFFEGSSFSYQSYKTSLNRENDLRDAAKDKFDSTGSQGFFMADHSGPIKGGVAYLFQDENGFERTRLALHGAAPLGKDASLGVSYNYIQDVLPRRFRSNRHQSHHMATIGTTHIIDEDTILGIVLQDPTRTIPGYERVIAGFQYNVADRFTLIGDVGTQYTKDVSDKYLWRAAIQLNIFSDFFLRGGQFYDNIEKLKGTGWGISWIGPRFGVEFAQKFSEQYAKDGYVYEDEKIVDTSFSVILKI